MQKKVFKDHITFSFEENDEISNLGVKTLLKHRDKILPLRKVSKNGELLLVCSTEGFERVDTESSLTSNQVVTILKDLSELFKVCRDSAFLDCSYVNVSKEMIFYDERSDKYFFPVVPVEYSDFGVKQRNFESGLERFISDIFSAVDSVPSTLETFRDELLAAPDKTAFIVNEIDRLSVERNTQNIGNDLELEYNGTYGAFSLYICKDGFVIGKSDDCDGALSMNPTISRHHCLFNKSTSGWFITDLGSSNGTFVSNMRLVPNQPYEIKRNDVIRISDMDFVVK